MEYDDALLAEAGRIYKVLANPKRLKILLYLENNPANVSTIMASVGLPQPLVSHQLAILHEYQLVSKRKQGTFVYYELDDPHILEIVTATLGHVAHEIKGEPHPHGNGPE
ncbi:ArsR/SmtB family transcription factor [Lacticaseibacillus zhaodongensis]|uniref:ArsR/SmtB family transcription factor n=1 Tax=Lacticaseibacillus zhaodongensis TaxID=2668065 RepID=UPI0012D2DCA9|nr:metalloregulator ArsR/SmtB family transcription factor [Lacticaseibacillus zhaodongensis]